MKKLMLLLSLLIIAGCSVPPPKQVQPNMDEEIVGLQDIPLTNMPGHEPPECPLECLCPNWFGLSESPCKKPESVTKAPPFRWYSDNELADAAVIAAEYDRLLLIVLVDTSSDFEHNLFMELADKIDNSRCAQRELRKHYVPVVVGWQTYNFLRKTGELAWLPGDYVMSPAVMFAKVHKEPNGYQGEVLPITFEGHINADMCSVLQSFYGATR